jgi:Cu/Ag efflux pump CusA
VKRAVPALLDQLRSRVRRLRLGGKTELGRRLAELTQDSALLAGGALSIGSVVGFVTLFGITMRNSVMMVSHFEHLVALEGQPWGVQTALRGASERLLPILMTALVTGLGLLPIALGSGEVGREIEGPMAIVILGGLVTSTVLNLLVLPVLALRFGRFGVPGEPCPASPAA